MQQKSVKSQVAQTGWSEQIVYVVFFPVEELGTLKDLGVAALSNLKEDIFRKHLIKLWNIVKELLYGLQRRSDVSVEENPLTVTKYSIASTLSARQAFLFRTTAEYLLTSPVLHRVISLSPTDADNF